MDMMMVLYNAMMADDYIKQQASGRIKFYEYPESGDVSGPYIIIDSLSPPLDSDFGDDEPITEEYMYQIDVWTKNRLVTKEIAKRISKIMRSVGFVYFAGALDEYDKDSKIFRDARRYLGKSYTDEFKDAQ